MFRAARGTSLSSRGFPDSQPGPSLGLVRPGAPSSPVQEIMTVPGRLSKVDFARLNRTQRGDARVGEGISDAGQAQRHRR
jgi:hypothetical protein